MRILEAHGINTLYALDTISDEELATMPRIGKKAMEEIHAVQIHIPSECEHLQRKK